VRRGVRAALAAVALVAGAAAGLAALDRAFPPDLGRLAAPATVVADAAGEPLSVLLAPDGRLRLPVRTADVDPGFLDLLIATEDKGFRHHPGVDPFALARAAGQWIMAGRVVSGGSTLTMQLARLLEPRPRTVASKLVEIARALQLEARFGKDEILAMYLTLAPYGGNVEGVRAASLVWFGKAPRHLDTGEAAILVALPQAPEARRPDRHPDRATAAAAAILRRTGQDAAAAAVVAPRRHDPPRHAPHLARRLARSAPGTEIATTLDGGLQRRLERLAREEAARLEPGATVAIVAVDVRTRRTLAWVGGHGTGAGAHLDMARAVRSPGSTLKPLIYALGFEAGLMAPGTVVDDAPRSFAGYRPDNFDRAHHGRVTVARALQLSLNVPAVEALDLIGAEAFVDRLRAAGVPVVLPDGRPPGLAVALGGAGTTLAALTGAYAALAGEGAHRAAVVIPRPAPTPLSPLVSAEAAAAVTAILLDAPRPDRVADARATGDRRLVAFKTGTSYGFRDAWAIGYGASHAVGVWVGRPDGTPRPRETGRGAAAPVLFRAFDVIPDLRGLPPAACCGAAADGGTTGGIAGPRPAPVRARADADRPRLGFPADGAVLSLRRRADGLQPVPLEASGGRPPLVWYVDGRPLPPAAPGAPTVWRPKGEGFTRIGLMDADGRTASGTVRILAAD
jgi:penicillin-binding protein 1C